MTRNLSHTLRKFVIIYSKNHFSFSNVVAPFLMKVKKIEESDIHRIEMDEEHIAMVDFDEKGFEYEASDLKESLYTDVKYVHLTDSLQENMSYCGWSKENRLPNGI
jgi:hypothetical protein